MKLTKTDLEMLPTWVTCGKHTTSLMEWILEDNGEPYEQGSEILFKVHRGPFFFLYYLESSNGMFLRLGEDAEFAGICHTLDYALYDLSYHLRTMVGIPEGIPFPSKNIVMAEVETAISSQLVALIMSDWDHILKEASFDKKRLIPAVDRGEMRNRAELLYLEEKQPESVHYEPKFSYGDISQFSDEGYLRYLADRERVVKAIARSWVIKNVPFISQQKVIFGCIREELRNIYENQNDRMHKIKRLRAALMETEKRTVVVLANKYGQSIQFGMKTEELKNRQGNYSAMCVTAKDRAQFAKTFRRQGHFSIDDIVQVLQKGCLLYDRDDSEDEI